MSLGGEPARRGGGWVALVLGALVLINLYVFVWDKKTSLAEIKKRAEEAPVLPPPAALPSTPLPPAAGEHVFASSGAPAQPNVIDGKVVKNDTLGRSLKKAGLTPPEADEVIHALNGHLDFKAIRAGQTYHIERSPDGRVRRFDFVVSKLQTVHATRNAAGELVGTSDTSQTKVEVKTIGGKIDSSLYAAIKASGESAALVDFFVDVFAYDLDFYNDTHDGDTFRVVVEKELKDGSGELVRYRKILAAEYRGKAGTFHTYAFDDGYFNEKGESSEKTFLKTPLKFTRITSGFDHARMHPILHVATAHLGVDYAAPQGTPVWAAATGTISFRAESGGAGNLVMIKHDNGIETAYMHLSKFADNQKVGQRVTAKTVIGYVGSTGMSTGPHLHFGVKENGAFIDPTKFVPVRAKGIAAHQLDGFRAEVARLDGLLGGIKIASASP